jgi:hypothetical protein
MRVIEWLFLPVFVMAGVFAFRSAVDRWSTAEGFASPTPDVRTTDMPMTDIPADKLQALRDAANPTPTDDDAIQAHKTLLKYIQNDYKKGVYFVLNIANQFFGPGLMIQKDMDPSTILANYRNPLQGV